MVSFKYGFNQDFVELQTSNWSGLETFFVNGKIVSRRLNFGDRSEYTASLHDGNQCQFKLMLDPFTQQLICRVYKQGELLASLKQGKQHLRQKQQLLQTVFTAVAFLTGIGIWVMS